MCNSRILRLFWKYDDYFDHSRIDSEAPGWYPGVTRETLEWSWSLMDHHCRFSENMKICLQMTSPYSKWSLKMRFRCAGAQCFNVLIFMWFKTWCEALSSRSPGAARLPKCPNTNFWFSFNFWWLWDRFWTPDDVPRYEIEYLAKAVISKESCGHIRIHCGEAWACVILESSAFSWKYDDHFDHSRIDS